jgi:Na+/alanine symporter
MIVAALLGMATKFCECTLAVKFRHYRPDGSVSGGPMYYLTHGIAAEYPHLAPLGRVLGVQLCRALSVRNDRLAATSSRSIRPTTNCC